ncbi:hypothetical protein GWK08_06505 [Leptobacterium flavescens]|uniref:Isoleucyl-tRNA synthetase n=1 Tax=Leptobacterium flavescens TaxID=472055 RepID=A0A6P0UKK2_9FLAO|nr:hypothetical protein [Leptobacterium flavescens]NER13082.1 hypothetical protein [Leptobacterium flavescens]
MKRIIQILFILILIALGAGFYIKSTGDHLTGDRIVGLAIIATAFILMPIFIYHQSKGKKMKDYMLTKENIDKMKEKKGKKPENQ